MALLQVSTQVLPISGPLPNSYSIVVSIKNLYKKSLYHLVVKEQLLTQTNVYFSTLSIDNYPISYARQLLLDTLIVLPKIDPEQTITLSYPISIYALTNDTGISLSNEVFNSIVSVVAKRKNKIFTDLNTTFIASIPLTVFPENAIGIVGGGLAGLTAAYQLSQNGYSVLVYEANNRLGGRCYSGYFPDGEVYEHGGELIDTDQLDILNLISELGLTVVNLRAAEKPKTQEYYEVIDYDCDPPKYVKYTQQEAAYQYYNVFNPNTGLTIFQQITNDANNTYPTNNPPPGPATPWPLTYGDPVLAATLDNTTVAEYINNVTSFLRPDGNGAKTKLGQFLKVAYVIEYGAEPCEQSSFNIIYLLGFQVLPAGMVPPNIPSDVFYPFGLSNETYHTVNGNSRIVEALLEQLQLAQVPIYMNNRLIKIVNLPSPVIDIYGNTPYQIIVVRNNLPTTILPFNILISAIPFSVYNVDPKYNNWGIDIIQANFSALKQYVIKSLAMSRNSKLNVQFTNRYWNCEGCNGTTFATSNPYLTDPCGGDVVCPGSDHVDHPCVENPECTYVPPNRDKEKKFQNTWEVSRAQPYEKGILVDYTGGRYADKFLTSDDILDPEERNRYLRDATCKFLKQLDFLLPNSTNKKNFVFQTDEQGNIVNVNSNNWKQSPYQRGAYSFWQPGQYIGGSGVLQPDGTVEPLCAIVPFAGYEGVAEPYNPEQTGNCHFAGEQTSYDNQGYLDGAVESGNRVFNEIVALYPSLANKDKIKKDKQKDTKRDDSQIKHNRITRIKYLKK